jgi:hypothetical protein
MSLEIHLKSSLASSAAKHVGRICAATNGSQSRDLVVDDPAIGAARAAVVRKALVRVARTVARRQQLRLAYIELQLLGVKLHQLMLNARRLSLKAISNLLGHIR